MHIRTHAIHLIVPILILAMATVAPAQDWQALGGPNGGQVVRVHEAADGTMLASTGTAGIFKSTDSGATWSATEYAGPDPAFLGEEPSGAMLMAHGGSGDVFVSTDHFETWNTVEGPAGLIEALVVVGDDQWVVAERSSGSLVYHLTTDGGGSWTDVLNVGFLGNNNGWASDGSTIYLSHSLGVVPYRSTDGGASWTEMVNPGGGAGVELLAVANDGSLIAARSGTMYRSTDMGDSWTETGTTAFSLSKPGIGSDGMIMLHNNYGLEGELYTSTDNGQSWSTLASPFDPLTEVAQILGTDDGFMMASTMGISKSTDDGASWTSLNEGLTAETVTSLAITAQGNVSVGTASLSHHMYIDGGWERLDTPGQYTARNASGTLFKSTALPTIGQFYRSTDNGVSWEATPAQDGFSISFVVFNSPGSDVFAYTHGTAGQSLRRSSDNGDSWTELEPAVPTDMAYSGNGNIYLTTAWEGLGVSSDNGDSWSWTPGANMQEVALAPDGTVFVSAVSYLHRSTDDGATLEDITSNMIPDVDFPSVAINAIGVSSAGDLYVDMDWVVTWPEYEDGGGVYVSTDNGETFTVQNDFRVNEFEVGRNGEFYAGTNLGVMQLGGTSVGDDPSADQPLRFSLAQNFPNPFNPTTTIAFTLDTPGQTQLVVYDVLGRQVAELVAGSMSAGTHAVTFDGAALASGVYLYTLTGAAGQQAHGRMLLVK